MGSYPGSSRIDRMSGTRLAMFAVSLTRTDSAFLLFQVQPIIAKPILPWLGVVPVDLTVCMASALLALVTYPVLVEPALSQRTQATWWGAGYVVFVLLGGMAGWCVTRAKVDAVKLHTPGAGHTATRRSAYCRWFAWPFTA